VPLLTEVHAVLDQAPLEITRRQIAGHAATLEAQGTVGAGGLVGSRPGARRQHPVRRIRPQRQPLPVLVGIEPSAPSVDHDPAQELWIGLDTAADHSLHLQEVVGGG